LKREKRGRRELKSWVFVVVLLSIVVYFQMPEVNSIEPGGANLTVEGSERAPADPAGSHEAQAGNVTQLDIFAYSTTQSWQGYYGNVSGVLELTDGSNNTLYNWTLANPQGEVYASTNDTIDWINIQCINFTSLGTGGDETGNGGTTNLNGTNLSILEERFNIAEDDVDGVDETFTLSGPGTHDEFFAASQQFTEGECRSTRVFGDGGAGVNDEFEEVLLYEPGTSSVIFAALLEESSVLGFDGRDYDFEMLVLEDGHGTDVATTNYYFYVELE